MRKMKHFTTETPFPSQNSSLKGKELAAVNETHHLFLPAPSNLLPLLVLFSRMLLWLIRKYSLTPSLPDPIWGFFYLKKMRLICLF